MENILWNGLGNVKPQMPLFDSLTEARLYHDDNKFGYFSILTQGKGGKKKQDTYRLPLMAEIIPLLPRERDTWISQAEFIKPNRRIVNLARLSLLFVDIDCYNVNMTADEALSMALVTCDDMGLPHPSVAINSGRGLQLKWILNKTLPRFVLPRWNAVQTRLVESFHLIGADPNAKDASRVLRMVGTINTKSGQFAQVVYASNGLRGLACGYDFEYLAEILLPNSRHLYDKKLQNHPYSIEEQNRIAATRIDREARRSDRKTVLNSSSKNGLHKFSGKQLAWHRLEDLRALVQLRNGVKPGQSMSTLFWMLNFLLLSGAANSSQFYFEADALCRELGFGALRRVDELNMLYVKAKEGEAGKTVTFEGREYPPLYTPTNQSMIEQFQITDDEQRQLRTVISINIAKERDRDRKRKQRYESGENKLSRQEYLSANDDKRIQARLLHAKGMSNRRIAEELHVSKDSIRGWLK